MNLFCKLIFFATIVGVVYLQETDDVDINVWDRQLPSIVICILIRNKDHTLPYFLGYLDDLDYPKDRIKLFIRVDHCVDKSAETIKFWLKNVENLYQSIDFDVQIEPNRYPDEIGPFEWTPERYRRIVELKEEALMYARRSWADYIFYLDCDVFLTDKRVLQALISSRRVAIAPLLISTDNDYSTFWTTTDDVGEFVRDDDWDALYNRERIGVWPVAVAYSALLIDLRSRKSLELTFDTTKFWSYEGIYSDLHILARSLKDVDARFYLLNDKIYGKMLSPMQKHLDDLELDVENMRFLALESLYDGLPGLLHSPYAMPTYPNASKFGFDEIYLINLHRRPDRLARMQMCFKLLGIDATIVDAVDGSTLTDDTLASMNVRQMPEYLDPYHKRSITLGEIGCFLSHYNIWKDVFERKYEKVLIFEDDLRFVRWFRNMSMTLFDDLTSTKTKWDLIYIGRKRLKTSDDGPMVPGVRFLSEVGYSYWTLAYALSVNGSEKLLHGDPLKKILPVDEYLPIMFDRHPEIRWKNHFPVRNLIAYTSEPLFVYPIRYTSDVGYVSDTENATIVDEIKLIPNEIRSNLIDIQSNPIDIQSRQIDTSRFSDEL